MKKRTGGGFSALTAKRGAVSNSSSGSHRRNDQSSDSVNESDEGIRSGSSGRSLERERNKRFENRNGRRDSDEDDRNNLRDRNRNRNRDSDEDDRNSRKDNHRNRKRGSDDERGSNERSRNAKSMSRGRDSDEDRDSDNRGNRSRDKEKDRGWNRTRGSDEERDWRSEQKPRGSYQRGYGRESPQSFEKWEDKSRRNHRAPSPPSISGSSESDKSWKAGRDEPRQVNRRHLQDENQNNKTSPRWQQQHFNSHDSSSNSSIKGQPPKTQLRGQTTSLDRLSSSNSTRLRDIRESEEETLTTPHVKKKSSDDRPLDNKKSLQTPYSEKDLRSRSFNKFATDSDVDESKGLSMVEQLTQSREMVKKSPFVDEPLRGPATATQRGNSMLALPWNRPPSSPIIDDLNASSLNRQTIQKPGTSRTLEFQGKTFGDTSSTRRLNRLDGRMGDLPIMSDNASRLSNLSGVSSLNGSLRSIRSMPSKEKSFLVGSPASSSGSMLGAAELERLFPHRRVRIYILTWNMASPKSDEGYPASWDELLLPPSVTEACDVFIVALQEAPANSREILLRIQETLGPCYLPLSSEFFGTLGLCVFMNRDLMWYCSTPQSASIKARQTALTKGAAAIAFQLFGTSFVFLSTHLKSDVGNIENRIEDYNKILQGVDLPKPIGGSADVAIKQIRKARDLTQRFDYTFWAGDLNFRITAERDTVEKMAQTIQSGEIPRYESLLKIDELFLTQTQSKAFEGFQEGRINFPPTYKYDLNSDTFDTSHLNRIPAYTDRILFHSKQKVTCNCSLYDSIRSVKTSDHRAVFAVYECDVKPGRDNIPLCAGDFDRSVYLEGIRRRANHLDYVALKRERSNSKVCSIS